MKGTSFSIRRHEALNGTTTSFDDWDVLAHFENVYELINYDFHIIHSESSDRMSRKHAKIKNLVEDNISISGYHHC